MGLERDSSFTHPLYNTIEILSGFLCLQALFLGLSNGPNYAGQGNDCLAWNAPVIEAITTHLVTFDQGGPSTQPSGTSSSDQTSFARSNDHNIVWFLFSELFPL